jgi:hypothetical protein
VMAPVGEMAHEVRHHEPGRPGDEESHRRTLAKSHEAIALGVMTSAARGPA